MNLKYDPKYRERLILMPAQSEWLNIKMQIQIAKGWFKRPRLNNLIHNRLKQPK